PPTGAVRTVRPRARQTGSCRCLHDRESPIVFIASVNAMCRGVYASLPEKVRPQRSFSRNPWNMCPDGTPGNATSAFKGGGIVYISLFSQKRRKCDEEHIRNMRRSRPGRGAAARPADGGRRSESGRHPTRGV